jgi:prepilin-type N-terminal cleavage/methylation domain-containing protein/prepilin-type processing-associated H-X9-DG protein
MPAARILRALLKQGDMMQVISDGRTSKSLKVGSGRHAFTLIELLVVIAIIAILAAILFPVFAKAREKARQTTCASNEKQLALAVLQYIQDYDETFPATWDSNRNPGSNWAVQIYPYVKSYQVYVCPSNAAAAALTQSGQYMGTSGGNGNSISSIPISYMMNQCLGFVNGGQWNYGPYHSEAAISEPSSKALILETTYSNASTGWDNWAECGGNAACTASNFTTTQIYSTWFAGHTGMMNVAFLDGHVKAEQPTTLFTPINQIGSIAHDVNDWTTNDPNCGNNAGNYTDPVDGIKALNCNAVSPSLVAAAAGVETKYK